MNDTATAEVRWTRALSAEHRARLMTVAREVTIPQGTRLFDEGGRADWFWIIRAGTVSLDMHLPGRRRTQVIETVGCGELVGWSWLFSPNVWQLGAEATTTVRALEFEARAVRRMCEIDTELSSAVGQWVGRILARRLQAARTRLLELYAPYGSGGAR
ncbi:Crp/Fnr family transcriptional regulator [Streptomyces flavofungini]|uniref:Crp/Fnr family transcriptional regulator n=1 Tax=Streptomyces flavofungini TaxID=68200 RepID=UPI0025B15F59|nr:cyclic nucleotide-binding domain-containing protein [Streptomyces flavofungini]WJV44725.1 cyclic nucleotide-binding domain-containing protein [Streptomyces flavofungini]